MLKQDPEHIKHILANAELLKSAAQVQQAIQAMAQAIKAELGDKDPLILSVMNGAMIPTAMLLIQLDFPLRLGYVHATRYNSTTRGGELKWLTPAHWSLANEHILIVDDIFDEGTTLELIVKHCQESTPAPKSVHSAVLVEKIRNRTCTYRPDFIGLTVPDRYVFGVGMDYKEYLRNLPEIYGVADTDLKA